MQDFWQSSGYQTLQRNDHGWLRVTPEYLCWLLARPELAPIDSSGAHERALHSRLLADPLQAVNEPQLDAIEDDDTRENYALFLRFRQLLLDSVTLERFYLRIFRKGAIDLPPLFIDLVAHAIVRGMLDGCENPYQLRAGEMFFRRQRISTEGGQVLAADAETIKQFAETGGFGNLGRLLARQGTPMRETHMDVMSHSNAQLYLLRENRYAWLLDITHGRNGIEALATLLAKWVRHFLGTVVDIVPLQSVEDAGWRWHIGLDVDSTSILNDLYENREVDDERRHRLVSLFRLTFADAADMRPDMAGKPVYLGMAVTNDQQFKLKPQNLLLNLPLAASAS